MIEDIARHILSYFSHDAYFWPKDYFDKSSKVPIKFFFEWKVKHDLEIQLSKIIAEILKESYISEENEKSYPIIISPAKEDADALVLFEEQTMHEQNGLAYEIHINGKEDILPGWFSLEME
ncbi:MAG TPA: hypothetical protein DCZ94_12490 [Lentisphaeria bacterium]|nr:MAG: hypothetical protein A2X48_21180 [Lentisphaerae bacterium GWF2_49_21]HBC87765.1 hypothetical protein [Lentisphaeria bacterium]